MAKMKIYEIARSLQSQNKELKSGDLVKLLNGNGFDVKGANSNIEDDGIAFLLKSFRGSGNSKPAPQKTAEKKENKVEKPSKHVNEKLAQQQTSKPVKPIEKPTEKTAEKAVDKPVEKSPEKKEISTSNSKGTPLKTEKAQDDVKTKLEQNSNHSNEEQPRRQYNNNNGGYNRNRDNNNGQGQGQGGYNRNNNGQSQGGYNRNNNNGQSQGQSQGGYNRNSNGQGQSQGGYNRNSNGQGQSQGGYNRNSNGQGQSQGGYNRNSNGQGQGQGGYNRNSNGQGQSQGGYNRNSNGQGQSQGGYNRNSNGQGQGQGGYNRNSNGQGQSQGGYNRNSNGQGQGQGGYNRTSNGQGQGQGGYNRSSNGQGQGQGGYNRNNNGQGQGQGGYNRNSNGGGQGGYNRNNNGGGQGGYNRNNNGQGGYNRDNNRGQGVLEKFEKSQSSFDGIKQETKSSRIRTKKQNNGNREGQQGRYHKSSLSEMNRIRSKKDPNRKGAFIRPEPVAKEPEEKIREIKIPENLTIKDLADAMKMPSSFIIKKLFLQGKMVSVNQDITFEEAEEIALEFEIIAEKEEKVDVVAEIIKEEDEDESEMTKRPPVVCVMGHVDHGKTSLLDAIREANVTAREAGGITQHIGAYVVRINGEKITFLDTPGHEAFTSMRMRGAQSTDIAILVVAADDGVMPQTVEAINHAKAAGVEIIVAINKIDKPGANVERVKQELAEYELIAEDWGGSTVFVPVSAHTKEGIDQLLDMILLTAEVLELKANKKRFARGVVIEAQLDKGRGPVATILVQKGTLRVGDNIAIGATYGKVRAMIACTGERVKKAGPSTPVAVLGLNGVPNAGEIIIATENDKEAKNIAGAYIEQGKEKLLEETKSKKLSLDGLFSQIQAGNIKDLNLIIKADVQGSVQAVQQSLVKLSNEEVAIRVIHGGVGAINESDVSLAIASNAIIIGFNIRPDNMAKEIADRENVDIRLYRVIYDAIADIENAMKGMLEPIYEEKVIAHAEIRQIFKASGVGTIAGSYVLDGKIQRGCSARITREGKLIFEGEVSSLKRFKDDVKEVATGYECGLVFDKFNELEEFDQVECYIMVEVPR